MVTVAQLVRAPVCGTGGRGFDTHQSPIHLVNVPHEFMRDYVYVENFENKT